MANRFPNSSSWGRPRSLSGSVSLQMLVILVPVIFGMMGFALDLGQLYLIRGELNQAAITMAVAAAAQLNGTGSAYANAVNVLTPPVGAGPAFTYNFGETTLGSTGGFLNSTVNPPVCFADATDATSANGVQADCSTAQFLQVGITADAPLLFWSLLPGGQSRKTTVAAQAVAGISAPLCTACNIVPFGVEAISIADPVNFGFDPAFSTVYTLAYACSSPPAVPVLPGTSAVVGYEIVNRYDTANALLSETDQLYVDAAAGVQATQDATVNACTGNASTPLACFNVGDCEQVWASASPLVCGTVEPSVTAALCGLYSRVDNSETPSACATSVTDFGALSAAYVPDTDNLEASTDPYSAYAGNGRRIITVPIVATIDGVLTILGFRQFLIELSSGAFFNPTDSYGRFPALYIGNPAPLQTGWFDARYASACSTYLTSGPGKVVLVQ